MTKPTETRIPGPAITSAPGKEDEQSRTPPTPERSELRALDRLFKAAEELSPRSFRYAYGMLTRMNDRLPPDSKD
jgi:hypothetical protein